MSDNLLAGIASGDSQRGAAIEVDQCRRVTINSNHITDPRFRGIEVHQSEWITISSSMITRNGQPMEGGILIRGENKGLEIEE